MLTSLIELQIDFTAFFPTLSFCTKSLLKSVHMTIKSGVRQFKRQNFLLTIRISEIGVYLLIETNIHVVSQ